MSFWFGSSSAPVCNFVQLPGYRGLLNNKIRSCVERLNKEVEPSVDWTTRYFSHLYQMKAESNLHGHTSISWRRHHVEEIYDHVYLTRSSTDNINNKKTPARDNFQIAHYIDHTLLKTDATPEQIKKLCEDAKRNHFCTVCVNGVYVAQCAALLKGSDVKVCCVIGFPLGANTTDSKTQEAKQLVEQGALEVDMVMSVGTLKSHKYKEVLRDIRAVNEVIKSVNPRAELKVILEVCLLTHEQLIEASILGVASGAEFIKTSTGFSTHGATPEAVDVMLAVSGDGGKVKAAGGIKDAETVVMYLAAGVSRIGTSNGVEIVKEISRLKNKKRPSIMIPPCKL